MFILTQFNINQRQRLWVLMDTHTCLPLLYTLQYLVDHLALRTAATQSASLQAIKFFYEFWYQKHGVTFCFSFNSSDHNPLIAIEELTAFFHYLENGHSCAPILTIGSIQNTSSRRTNVGYVHAVIRFMRYLINTYITPRYVDGSPKELTRLATQLTSRLSINKAEFRTFAHSRQMNNKITHQRFRSLTADMIMAFYQIITPDSTSKKNPLNPFPAGEIQLRNFLICRLLLNYGLRVSELLLLECHSIKPNLRGDQFSLIVTTVDEDIPDPRKRLPSLKNINANRVLTLLAAEAGSEVCSPTQKWIAKTRKAQLGNALRLAKVDAEQQLEVRSARYVRQTETRLQASGIELTLYARPNWKFPLPWPNVEFLAVVDLDTPVDWLTWFNEYEAQIRADAGESRQMWIIPRIAGFAVSQLTVGGVSSFFPLPHTVDDWLATLSIPQLDDALMRAAQPVIDLIVELDGLRCFGLGTDKRPILEQSVRQTDEHKLEMALLAFDASSTGTPVQQFLRTLSDNVASGNINLAEDVAVLTHGWLTPGAEMLINIQNALLAQDIVNAISNQ